MKSPALVGKSLQRVQYRDACINGLKCKSSRYPNHMQTYLEGRHTSLYTSKGDTHRYVSREEIYITTQPYENRNHKKKTMCRGHGPSTRDVLCCCHIVTTTHHILSICVEATSRRMRRPMLLPTRDNNTPHNTNMCSGHIPQNATTYVVVTRDQQHTTWHKYV
jgi:hypothetical protein